MDLHPGLRERFNTFSLPEQLLMFGSEIQRIQNFKRRGDDEQEQAASDRAFELLSFTIDDPRWRSRLRELTRLREVFADALLGGDSYDSTLQKISDYLLPFACYKGSEWKKEL